jgi:glucose-1-phosphate thymidylyltransferase
MKGVLLAGGTGSRLGQLTRVTNKHLLPIYNKPMIFYPLSTLIDLGIKEILVVTSVDFCGHISQLLGSGKDFGVELSYKVQDEAGGIAQALGLAEGFACGSSVAVILGDNIFAQKFNDIFVERFQEGAKVFLSKTDSPERFGVAEINDKKLIAIEEKPKYPKSNYAVTGLYMYDNTVFDCIRQIKPSSRNELEITDVNNYYIRKNAMSYEFLNGEWTDAGTFESLYRANTIAREICLSTR